MKTLSAENEADWGLVARVKGGDNAAFDALMARYRRPVLSFVSRMVADSLDAEDIAQDVFVRAYRNMLKPSFRKRAAAFSSWLFQVARNATLDHCRYRKRHPVCSLADMEAEALTGTVRTAADHAVANETGAAIAAEVAKLPEEQRVAIVLSEYEGLSYVEIAAIMHCSVKAVESRLYRARRSLRQQLRHLLA